MLATLHLTLSTIMVLTAPPPEAFRVEPAADSAAFIARLTALRGADSPAVQLARHVTSRLEHPATLAFIVAPWGTTGIVASMRDDVMAMMLPSGAIKCYADSGPCPADSSFGTFPSGVDYAVTIEMGTPAGLGLDGQVLVRLGEPDTIGIIRGFPAGDGAPERYDLVRFGPYGFGPRLLSDFSAIFDLDGDGHLDAETRDTWGTHVWPRLLFGDGRGRFAADPKRARAFHTAALTHSIAALDGALVPSSDEDLTCGDTIAPAIMAHAHAHLGGLALKPVHAAVRPWLQATRAALGPGWEKRCARALGVLACAGKLTRPAEAQFRRCLGSEVD